MPISNKKKNSRTRRLAYLLGVTLSYPVYGIEISGELNAGIGASDNIARTAQDPISDTYTLVGLKLDVVEESRRVQATVSSQFDYLDYRDETFDAELIGGLNGVVEFSLVEERVAWIVQDNYGQQLFDPFTPATPSNREDVNLFTTGPTFNFLSPGRNHVDLDLRYSSENFERRPDDNDRYSGRLQIGRDINRESSVSFGGLFERVKFDGTAIEGDYDRVEGYIRYEATGKKNYFQMDAGATDIDSETFRLSGPLIRINWTNNLSPKSRLIVSGGSALSDRSGRFRTVQDDVTDLRDTIDITVLSAPFRNDFFTANYRIDQDRTNVDFRVSWAQEDYEGRSIADRDSRRSEIGIRRDLSRTVFGTARLGYIQREFKGLDRQDDDIFGNLGIGIRIGSRFRLIGEFRYLERDSDADEGSFTDRRYSVRGIYTPRWMR